MGHLNATPVAASLGGALRQSPPGGTPSPVRHCPAMKTLTRIVVPLASLLCCAAASAEELKPQEIEDAKLEAIGQEPPQKPAPHPDPAIVHLQVLLDRTGSSPGVIDGFDGDNVRKAVAGFEAMHDLPVDG